MKNEAFNKAVIADLNALAAKNKLSGLEKIKQIHIVADQFTIENDILTPSLKIKRNIAKKVYDNEIRELYAKPLGV